MRRASPPQQRTGDGKTDDRQTGHDGQDRAQGPHGRPVGEDDVVLAGRQPDRAKGVVGALDPGGTAIDRGCPTGLVCVGEDEVTIGRHRGVDDDTIVRIGDDSRLPAFDWRARRYASCGRVADDDGVAKRA